LAIGTADAVDSSLLPDSFKTALGSTPPAQVVKLGPHMFKRYLNVTPPGATAPVSVYSLVTTKGAAIAACVLPQTDATVFATTCERILASLTTSAQVLPLGANSDYAKSLGSIITRLDAARATDGRQLSAAKKARDQATAAARLAQAYQKAASATAGLNPGPVGAAAGPPIVAAMRSLGSGYTSLATAARANNKAQYASAQRSITRADTQLGKALATLRQDGYTVG
jgi:hypothetical protein